MAEEKKKYTVCMTYSVDIEAENEAAATIQAAYLLRFSEQKANNLTISVIPPADISKAAIEEAPYADQVTVDEDRRGPVERSVGGFLRRVVNEPAPLANQDIPPVPPVPAEEEDGSGLPPVSTSTAELVEAFTKPDEDGIPF